MSGSGTSSSENLGVIASLKALPNVARLVLLGVFINQFGALLQMFMVLYLVHRGFSEEQGGFALGVYGVGAIVGLLFGGTLSDRLGPRLTIVVSMSTSAVMVLAVTFLDSYIGILIAVACAGAMTQANRPASAALLTDYTPPSQHVMVMAMNRIALNGGAVVGPLVAALLIKISWDLVLYLAGAMVALYALIALFFLPSPQQSNDAAADGSSAGGSVVSYLTLLRDGRFVLFLLAMLTNATVHVQYYSILPLDLTDSGYPEIVYSSVFAVSAGMVLVLELWITKYTQRWQPWLAASLGLALLGTGLTGFGLPGGLVVLFASVVIASVGQMVGAPTIFAWPVKVAPKGGKGKYLGTALAMFSLGNAIGPMIGVPVYQRIGDAVWWICGAIAVLSALAAALAMRNHPALDASTESAASDDQQKSAEAEDQEQPVTAESGAAEEPVLQASADTADSGRKR